MEVENFFGNSYPGTNCFKQSDRTDTNITRFNAVANDYMERGIDLNEQLIRNKPATFFMRVKGDSMTGAGIHDGDVVIVDRAVKALSGKVIIAALNGEMLIRRFEKNFSRIRLVPETAKLSPIDIDLSGSEFSIWGVVTYVIHSL